MRALVAGAVVVAVLAGPVAGARAADSLALTPPANPTVDSTATVAASGTASASSVVAAFAEAGAGDCAANWQAQSSRPGAIAIGSEGVGGDPVAAGAITLNLPWTPSAAGTYLICGYLYGDTQVPSEMPLATSTPVSSTVKVADSDGDGVPDNVDACVNVAGTQADGCPPASITPVLPGTPSVPALPSVPAAPTVSDPTGVMKLKSSKGRTKPCGSACLIRTRTVGPFSFSLKVKVSGGKTSGSGSLTLTRKSAQAGEAGKVCLGSYAAKTKRKCRTVTWKVGKKVTLTGSISTPTAIRKSGRPGFSMTAYVGQIVVGGGDSIYLKSAGGRILPDTDEAACISSAHAHAAC